MGKMIRQFIRKLSSSSDLEHLDRRKSEAWNGYILSPQVQKEQFLKKWEEVPKRDATVDDFVRVRTIGTGTFGRVLLVKNKKTDKYLALKALDKSRIVRMKQVEHTIHERKILSSISFPFIVELVCSFKDNANLYMAMEYIPGGELFRHLRHIGKFEENVTKFFTIQIVLAIEYLHNLEIVYRDLKPENILLDSSGYIKLTDFGFAKRIQKSRTYTLCGTPEYLAPEIILSKGYNDAVDWWSLGVLIFEMIAGFPPFYADSPIQIYEKIVEGRVSYPSHLSYDLRDILKGFLKVDPTARLGSFKQGPSNVKGHRWFSGVDWIAYLERRIVSPYKPVVSRTDMGDSSNYDEYPEEPIVNTVKDEFSQIFDEF